MSSLRLNTGFCARNTLPMNPVRSYPVLRFTNAFSIKVDNLAADGSAFLYLNFSRIHRTLKVTPVWRPA